jgi:type I restriction enzyme R subunit
VKKSLSETDICDRYITPAMERRGWSKLQIRREFGITPGPVLVRGKMAARGSPKRADYVLFHAPNLPLAVIEAKDNNHSVGAGMQQALGYAVTLDVPFVFSSNGDGFLFHDRTGASTPVERLLSIDEFPDPAELWSRYRAWKGLSYENERVVRFPYHDDGSGREPRYYQRIAVQRTIEAVTRGQRRVLLVMATGSGKTYTAFQIMWRLWKAGSIKRVLFLTDRSILVQQPFTRDFKPFGGVMTKVKDRTVDKSYEIYLALYQAITSNEEERQIYRQFSPEFFDLIVIDECHRGSASEQSAWRDILEWFKPAIQLGLTATPKETTGVSTLTYFGEPVYTYSLKQGIADGFLAPYKVVRIDLDRDLQGWRPPAGMRDDKGQEIADRVYNQRDMDRVLVLHERTKRVAEKVMEYLVGTDPYGKTIVFCEDIDHAERMRSELVNAAGRLLPAERDQLSRYAVRITGESDEARGKLDDFIHVERRYPVIATTSKLLTTGVDVEACRLVVIDQRIESMIEFKQIIGRGTRIREDAGKLWFTVMDFKKATELFADPDFDGPPIVVYEPDSGASPVPPDAASTEEKEGDAGASGEAEATGGGRVKYVVSGVSVAVIAERVQYYGKDGKLITETLRDYTRSTVQEQYSSLDAFIRRWSEADRKQAVIDELREHGVLLDELREQVGKTDLDPFDLLCHVVYDRPPLTRKERAAEVKKRDVFTKYGDKARGVLDALLDKYADEGVFPEDTSVLRVQPIARLGTVVELIKAFGGQEAYVAAVKTLEAELYKDAG